MVPQVEIPHLVSKYLLGLGFLQCGCYRHPDSSTSRETPEPIFAGFSDALRNVKTRRRPVSFHVSIFRRSSWTKTLPTRLARELRELRDKLHPESLTLNLLK